MTTREHQPTLDDIDRRIIGELQVDGRKAYTQMAPVVGLSEAAVRQRVQRLVDSGVMQIVAVTDPKVLGFSRQAMIGIQVEGDALVVADAVGALAEVEYVVLTAGGVDLLVEVVVEDDESLLELLNEQIRKIPGVRRTETYVYLRIHKETYQWGAAP
ncbi:MAG TPA: Lrp/AsnC family transcriptional regulator [Acidimicrobiales bacterium]|nr:Lrp/AsnC family transcriptional regulator [Acidimicrobiales bacterium]